MLCKHLLYLDIFAAFCYACVDKMVPLLQYTTLTAPGIPVMVISRLTFGKSSPSVNLTENHNFLSS